mmetsp:Transcript_20741/g.39440  ORF Transcript_20741/g.39440 Transcript_20741/m.39440 type:complete len:289 (-) Transcript_20741:464-1330(-)
MGNVFSGDQQVGSEDNSVSNDLPVTTHVETTTQASSRPEAECKGSSEQFMPMSSVNDMMVMFQQALGSKNVAVEEMGENLVQLRQELMLSQSSNCDEQQLLNELQRLLKLNATLEQTKSQLVMDNNMLQQEGDLLAQQLESVTFYMKSASSELEHERRLRVQSERKHKEAREALRILYRDVQVLSKSMSAQREIIARGTAAANAVNAANAADVASAACSSSNGSSSGASDSRLSLGTRFKRKEYILPGNLAEELEQEYEHQKLLDSKLLSPRTSSLGQGIDYKNSKWI